MKIRASDLTLPGGRPDIAVGLNISELRLTQRATANERLPQRASRLKIAALLAHRGPSWGNNDQVV